MHLVHTESIPQDQKLPRVGRSGPILLMLALFLGSGFTRPQKVDSSQQPLSFIEPKHLSLVIALHPHCPCSNATVGELVKMYHRVPEEIKLTVLAFTPDDESNAWMRSASLAPLVHAKARILSDVNGETALRLGMTTSGQVQLFSPNGKLLYNGGITDACSRSGKNRGEEMVMEIIHGSIFQAENFPAHGCALFEANDFGDDLKFAQRL